MRTVQCRFVKIVCALFLFALLLANVGCQTMRPLTDPVRAIWVTRMDYKTAGDVVRIMDDCEHAGFNTVMFQVRGNGTAFYESAYEPWDNALGGGHPGFDPLALACRAAHDRDMELHAWVNVMPAWRGKKPPHDPEQLYNKKPEWFWYDQHGKRQALSTFYVSLNPCLPDVRDYLVNVFRDIVANYDVDGLHLDYIRFPNEPPATPRGSGLDYPYDQRTLALYRADTGKSPDDDKTAWNQWRTDQVTKLVQQIHDMMRETRPDAALSASVGTNRQRSLHHFRDGRLWLESGLLDAAFPMNYKDNLESFRTGLAMWMPLEANNTIVPGIWFSPRVPEDKVSQLVRRQIDIARHETDNFCLFAYSSIFERGGRNAGKPKEQPPTKQAGRRAVLMPYLHAISESDRFRE